MIAGTVHLEGDWKYHLEDHKGRLIRGDLRDGLMKQIYEKILPLIEAAQNQERNLKLANIAARLSQSLVNVGIRGKGDR